MSLYDTKFQELIRKHDLPRHLRPTPRLALLHIAPLGGQTL